MRKTLLLILAAGAASISSAWAQNDFQPGYVVPTGADTVRGLVDNRGALALSRQVRFKATAESSITEYTPQQLSAAGFRQGQAYESVPVAGTPAFLLVLAKGPASLYRLTDANDRQHYYVLSAKQPLTELIQRDTVQEAFVAGATHRVKSRTYPFRQVLATAFTGCYTITGDLAKAELKESTLVKLFQSYYACQNGGVPTGRIGTRRKSKANFTLTAGLNQGTISFVDYEVQSTFKSKQRPVFGAGFNFVPGSFNEKLALSMEVLYNHNDEQNSYERKRLGTNPTQYTVTMSWHNVMVPLLFRYTFAPRKTISPFVQVGPQASLRLKTVGTYRIYEDLGGGSKVDITNPVKVQPMAIHGVIGAGVQIAMGRLGTIRPEVRYMRTDNVSDPAVLSHESILNFLVTYSFGQ